MLEITSATQLATSGSTPSAVALVTLPFGAMKKLVVTVPEISGFEISRRS